MVVPQTEIIITKDGAELLRRVVSPGEYLIGRGEDCAFCVLGEKISRHHARLFVSFQDWSVADLGSANGTQLGDEAVGVEAVKVWPSQKIRVGDATIELRALAPSDPSASLMPTQQTVRRYLPPELQGARRYQIGKQVAQGGMGAILDALDVSTRRNVAMKVMLNVTDTGDVLRFIEEAQVTAQLEHPNIVPVHELSVNEQGEVFYTMKMVRGITLKKVIELLAKGAGEVAKKYPLAALLTIFQKVCDAIAFAHSKGVIHRDLKPENIMLGDYGEVLVMDWGLARLVGSAERASVVRSAKADEGDAMRTQTGSIMGTPTYMSPEQARGEIEKLDARSDIYALGTILFELLHLRPGVTGAEVMQVVSKVQRGAVEWDTGKTQIPASLLAVCRKALALSIAARYPRVEDLQADLLAFQNGFATRAEKAGLGKQLLLAFKRHKAVSIATAAAVVLLAAVGTVAFVRISAERTQVKAALTRLTATAPTFAAHARALLEEQKPEEALHTIDDALLLAPQSADYHLLRGHLLALLMRLDESEAAYARATPDAAARRNRDLCAKLRQQYGEHPELGGPATQALWQQAQAEGRNAEARYLSTRIQLDADKLLATWHEYLRGLDYPHGMLSLTSDKNLRLHLERVPVSDLTPFVRIPFVELELIVTKVTDLSPLRGKPLRRIYTIANAGLTDYSVLKGMPMQEVNVNEAGDLTPLAGAPLRQLTVVGSSNRDWNWLRQAPLEALSLNTCTLDSLAPVADKQLTTLVLDRCPITDLSPVRHQPIRTLSLSDLALTDLTPLSAMPLEDVQLAKLTLEDWSVLKGKPLRIFTAREMVLRDVEFLRGTPLTDFQVSKLGRPLDVSPLADCPQLRDVVLDPQCTGLEKLRHVTTIARISIRDEPSGAPAQPAAEFWAAYDAQQAAGKK